MISLKLHKKEKLCSQKAIDTLFSPSGKTDGGNCFIMAYPWRTVWRVSHRPDDDTWRGPRFLISVPKKRLRHAVDRVLMRRRIREAYRLTHQDYPLPEGTRPLRCREAYRLTRKAALSDDATVDIAFIYVGQGLTDYDRTHRAIEKTLSRIQQTLSPSTQGNESDQ